MRQRAAPATASPSTILHVAPPPQHQPREAPRAPRIPMVVIIMFMLCVLLIGFYVKAILEAPSQSNRWPSNGGTRVEPPEVVYTGQETIQECIGKIPFPFNSIINDCYGRYRPQNDAENTTDVSSGLPVASRRGSPFCGQQTWLKRLRRIEHAAMQDPDKSGIRVTRGTAAADREISSFDGSDLGSTRFVDDDSGPPLMQAPPHRQRRHERYTTCWTEGLAAHYIARHNVVPARDFYYYVIGKSAKLESDRNTGRAAT